MIEQIILFDIKELLKDTCEVSKSEFYYYNAKKSGDMLIHDKKKKKKKKKKKHIHWVFKIKHLIETHGEQCKHIINEKFLRTI